jgi:hypothetical protein
MLRIRKMQVRFVPGKPASAACLLKRDGGKIYSGGLRSRSKPLQVVSTYADANLQHSLSARFAETGKLQDVRLQGIADAGVRFEILGFFQVAAAARISIPKRLNPGLEISGGRRNCHDGKRRY